jgi:hypothetical protein
MGPDHVCSGTVVQDDNIPDDLVSAILMQMSFSVLLAPSL